MKFLTALTVLTMLATVQAQNISQKVTAALEKISEMESAKYNCTVGIGVISRQHSIKASAASGLIDRKGGVSAKSDSMFVWGSVTKVLTGMNVLRLVDQGAFSLDASISPLIDPFIAKMKKADPSLKFGSLEDLFGEDVKKVTVRDLISMRSGIPDYDTATPYPKPPTVSHELLEIMIIFNHIFIGFLQGNSVQEPDSQLQPRRPSQRAMGTYRCSNPR